MDKEKIDIEAKSRGCEVYDYELYKHMDKEAMIISYVFVFLFAMLCYVIGYIGGKGGF